MMIAGEALESNITVIGPLVLQAIAHCTSPNQIEGVHPRFHIIASLRMHFQLLYFIPSTFFRYPSHQAKKGYLIMTYWIPDGPFLLSSNASHYVEVGSFVINHKDEWYKKNILL
ncbi:uncharacterized protein LOC125218578 [Salvia hispanica]|uniref:uncharacterized protein LOC125218578 n=1 Tax=Salvia hispanica TaxID=49212 RepID=UPI0020097925|nr:uncharacterized protein LOC125218578 [Salvia hispanica]